METIFHGIRGKFVALFGHENPRIMFAELILRAFEKAIGDVHSSEKRPRAIFLEDEIFKDNKYVYGERSLRDYYTKASKGETNFTIPIEAADPLARYVGTYKDYADFVDKNRKRGFFGILILFFRSKYGIFTAIASLILITGSILGTKEQVQNQNDPNYMIWRGDRYAAVYLDSTVALSLNAERINPLVISDFKKVDPDCDYPFFKEDGLENLWYGKNNKGELEYFTYLYHHPETGISLKKITRHMIVNHICPTYPN